MAGQASALENKARKQSVARLVQTARFPSVWWTTRFSLDPVNPSSSQAHSVDASSNFAIQREGNDDFRASDSFRFNWETLFASKDPLPFTQLILCTLGFSRLNLFQNRRVADSA
jgi:hypothetical protein